MPSTPTMSLSVGPNYIQITPSGGGTFQHYRLQKSLPSFEGGRFVTITDSIPNVPGENNYIDYNVPSGMVVSYRLGAVDSAGVVAYSLIGSTQLNLATFSFHPVSRDPLTNADLTLAAPLSLTSVAFSDVRSRRLAIARPGNQVKPDITPGSIVDYQATFPLVLHGTTRDSDYRTLLAFVMESRIVCARDPFGEFVFGVIIDFQGEKGIQWSIPLAVKRYPYSEEIL